MHQSAQSANMAQPHQWINCSVELPPINEDVLFCCKDENGDFQEVLFGWYEGQKTMGEAIVMETSASPLTWYPCTHWMRLPDPPSD